LVKRSFFCFGSGFVPAFERNRSKCMPIPEIKRSEIHNVMIVNEV